MTPYSAFIPFLRESNRIEGLEREITPKEIEAFASFYREPLSFTTVIEYQKTVAPTYPLRTEPGMNVRVGSHIAPAGGPEIAENLLSLLVDIGFHRLTPYVAHCKFLTLHPFMDGNGRTSRAIWARHMRSLNLDPFIRPFLHTFYYQTLEAADTLLERTK